eukprot:472889-Amphidinium_carterae.1
MCVDRVSSGAEVFHDKHISILSKFAFRDYQTFIDKRKLTFFLRLATVECDVVRSAALLDFGKFSIWPSMFEALSRLRASMPALQELPEPCETTLGEWVAYVISHHLEWKKWVREFRGPPTILEEPIWSEADKVEPNPEPEPYDSEWEDTAPLSAVLSLGVGRSPARDQPAEFLCSMCSFKGKSQAGLVMHQRRKHGIQSDLSLRTTSPVCPCCGSNCGRRARVLDHYKISRRCAAYTLEHFEPLTPKSFEAMMKLQRTVDETFSREHIPKPGRKPAGVRPPLVAYSPQFVDDIQRDASLTLRCWGRPVTVLALSSATCKKNPGITPHPQNTPKQ